MSRQLSTHPTKSILSETIEHRTKLYSIAAAAAGVSILAMVQPAEGEVVVTRKNIPIPVSVYGGHQYLVPISLNNDGITDFSFSLYSFAYHSFFQDLTVTPVEGGAIVGAAGPKGVSYASALVRGAKIGPSAHFSSQGRADVEVARGFNFSSTHYSRKLYGNWGGSPANRYLGVRFLIDGATHYGWIRLTVNTQPHTFSATITGYAYETVANKRILAGISAKDSASSQAEPNAENVGQPSLGMLALGANGLALWRSDETLVH